MSTRWVWEAVDLRPVPVSDGWRVAEAVLVTEDDDSMTVDTAVYPLVGWAIMRPSDGERYSKATDIAACWYDPHDAVLTTPLAADAGRVVRVLSPGEEPDWDALKTRLEEKRALVERLQAKR